MDEVLSFLGLAMKAGKVVSGEFATEKAVKAQKACLVLVSEEASDNTKKMFRNMCAYYDVPIYFYGTRGNLGHAIGKEYRASLAVTDPGFGKSLEKKILNARNDAAGHS